MSLQVIVLCIVLFAPIAWMILASFKNRTEITKYPPELFSRQHWKIISTFSQEQIF